METDDVSEETRQRAPAGRAPYLRFVWTACGQTLVLLPRRKMTYLAAMIAFTPVIIPLALTLPDELWYEVEGQAAFVRIAQLLYINALCPLLALFFGCMLVGEDIESETFPYVLTRPVPRSAWVLGKFLAYLVGVNAMLIGSLAAVYLGCTFLSQFSISAESIRLFADHAGVMALALAAYGAVALLLGALVNRPMIWGLILFFLWQRIALALPGKVDLLTIDKYVSILLPGTQTVTSLRSFLKQVANIQKIDVVVQPWMALTILLAIAVVFVALSARAVQRREYFSARSIGS